MRASGASLPRPDIMRRTSLVRRSPLPALALALALLAPMPAAEADDGAGLRALYARPAAQWPAAHVDDTVAFVELGALELKPTVDGAQSRLGARLFHDPLLSKSATRSCASCHDPSKGWSDGRILPPGAPLSGRHVPSLYTAGYRTVFGWDGAATSLQRQSLRPLLDRDEMGNPDLAAVVDRLRSTPAYGPLFAEAYGEAAINGERIANALAAFQARLEKETRFDTFVRGGYAALTDREIRGLHIFRTKGGCANCHFGPLLTDERFHNLGLSAFREPREDLGRYRVTGRPEHAGQFRTPSLRHVGRTAPYMHSGLFASLEGVVNFYARGGGEVWPRSAAEAQAPLHHHVSRVDPLLRLLTLDAEERAALVAFLEAL